MSMPFIKEESYTFLSKAYDVSGPETPPLTFDIYSIGAQLRLSGFQIEDIVRELTTQGIIEPFMGTSTNEYAITAFGREYIALHR